MVPDLSQRSNDDVVDTRQLLVA